MRDDFHRGIVEGMSCGVLTSDTEGRILTVNELARQILEIDGTVEGRSCGEVLQHHARLWEVMRGSFGLSTLPSRAELELRTRDDRGRTIGFSISRIRGSDGAELGLALFFKDLTQVEKQEEQERLRDRLVVLGEMAAQMAHEIRNPIASIDVTAQLVRRRLISAGASAEPVDRISREVGRIERTIASCLEYVRPVSLTLRPQSLPRLLEQALEEARRHEKAGGVLLELDCGSGLDPFPCDGPMLRQVFYNLLLNSIEAMGGKGRVRLRAWAAESSGAGAVIDEACVNGASGAGTAVCLAPRAPNGESYAFIQVSDTGPGIPEALRDRVFLPFYTTKTKGTGIGLAMAREIAELHRGVIDVSSKPGEGTTFTIKLPFAGV